MSDDRFQTIKAGDQTNAGPLRPAEPPPHLSVEAMPHLTAIAADIAQGFRHLADLLPAAAQPLARIAQTIEQRIDAVRGLMERPVSGPQQDHS